MAWDPPTTNDFKNRFPTFRGAEDELVQAILDEAVAEVGPGWIERDRTPGVLHLAAHRLALQGYGVQNPGGGGAALTGAIKSRTVGDVRTEFASPSGTTSVGSSLSQYQMTEFGKRYAELLRRNFPAVAVV